VSSSSQNLNSVVFGLANVCSTDISPVEHASYLDFGTPIETSSVNVFLQVLGMQEPAICQR
jgi:hypothetical protein